MLAFSGLPQRLPALCALSFAISSMACAPRAADVVPVSGMSAAVQAPADTSTELVKLDHPFLYAYGTWEKRVRVEGGQAILSGEGVTAKGGAGDNVSLSLAGSADRCPTIQVKVGANNKLKTLRLLLKDDSTDRSSSYEFPLPDKPTDDFVTISARGGATLGNPNAKEKGGADLGNIHQWQLMGDWSGDAAVDLKVESLLLTAPDPAAQTGAAPASGGDSANPGATSGHRSSESPKVVEIGRVAPDIVAVTIEAGRVQRSHLEPYVAQSGDERRTDGDNVILKRNGQEIGWLVGANRDTFIPYEKALGDPLNDAAADDPASYTVTGSGGAFAGGVQPVSIWRKSKPIDTAQPAYTLIIRHIVYLKMPQPLTSGQSYKVHFGDKLNVQPGDTTLVCDDARTRSEAVHVSQIGFRPDDPVKRGILSIWLGTGGGYEYAAPPKFFVVDDATGAAVLSGVAALAKSKDGTDKLWQGKAENYQKTAIYQLDFSALQKPGRYRISVDGVGASYPFVIGNDVWRSAFVMQMHGLFNERSGVALGPPYTSFQKPRDFYPGDSGVTVTQSTYNVVDGGKVEDFAGMAKGDTGVSVPQAWGGYHDAGDWNPRRVTHLQVSMAQMELLQEFPQYFRSVKLNIPSKSNVPDVLTEALFELDLFRRLQKPDGGVPFQIETNGDPGGGTVSYKSTMHAYVSAPDPWASWYYAAAAARASLLLESCAPELSRTYRDSAIKAMAWAEKDYSRRRSDGSADKITWEMRDARNLAALLCYDLTGEQRWYSVFLENTCLQQANAPLFAWGDHVQRDAAFAYALLPASRHPDADLKSRAVAGLLQQADTAIAYAAGNSYGIATPDSGKPMFNGFWSMPDAIELCRAHYLTGDRKYLAAAVQACVFAAGGNPNNMTYTTGLGSNPPRHPLHLDSRWSGQAAPEGLTIYGNFDWPHWPDQKWALWPMQYYLGPQCKPSAYDWPVPEAYFDIFLDPAINEFTVDNWTPNVYTWGYLAARADGSHAGTAVASRR